MVAYFSHALHFNIACENNASGMDTKESLIIKNSFYKNSPIYFSFYSAFFKLITFWNIFVGKTYLYV